MTAAKQPGWYRDPDGPGMRYFDGTEWTEARAHRKRAGWLPGVPDTAWPSWAWWSVIGTILVAATFAAWMFVRLL